MAIGTWVSKNTSLLRNREERLVFAWLVFAAFAADCCGSSGKDFAGPNEDDKQFVCYLAWERRKIGGVRTSANNCWQNRKNPNLSERTGHPFPFKGSCTLLENMLFLHVLFHDSCCSLQASTMNQPTPEPKVECF